MASSQRFAFDISALLTHAGLALRTLRIAPNQVLFSQGEPADSIFCLESGRVRLGVVSSLGHEAVITTFTAGDFVGTESLAPIAGKRQATATAIEACAARMIRRDEMLRLMGQRHELAGLIFNSLMARSIQTQSDLVDQLFNLRFLAPVLGACTNARTQVN